MVSTAEAGRDLHLLERLSALYPAVVADCLDRLGYRQQVMEPHIQPLFPEAKLAGYSVTVHCIEVDTPPVNPDDYYKGELQSVDALRPGDVIMARPRRRL